MKKPGVLELGTNDAILAQNKLISQQVELLTQQIKELREPSKAKQIACCELCKGDHDTGFCPPPGFKDVNYMGNQRDYQPRQQQQQPYQHPKINNNTFKGIKGSNQGITITITKVMGVVLLAVKILTNLNNRRS